MEQINNMDLEQLALWTNIYGSNQLRESQREANLTNIALAREASAFSANEAQKNRQWQENMSNTAHTREMADLIRAGLNPILTATGGHGAGIGSGAQGTAQLGRVQSELDENPLKNLASSVYDARRMREIEKAQLVANLEQTKSNVAMANSNIALNSQTVENQKIQALKTIEEISTQKTIQDVNSAQMLKTYQDAIASGEYAKLMQSQQGYYNTMTEGYGYENLGKKVKNEIYNNTPETQKGLSILEWIKSWIPLIK